MSKAVSLYVSLLRKRPWTTNVSSAVVLMMIGDFCAQEIEMKRHNQLPKDPEPKLSFRRYGTLSPNVVEIQRRHSQRQNEIRRELHELAHEASDYDYVVQDWKLQLESMRTKVVAEIQSLDVFRAATMAVWTGFVSTPINIYAYNVFDRYLPHGTTTRAVAPRVVLSFLQGIPQTTVFFAYGCLVHHTTNWFGLVQEWRYELQDYRNKLSLFRAILEEVPYDADLVLASTRLKLENELVSTTVTAGMVWIPLNSLNFALVPAHLRPVFLLVASAGWNIYMSLAQHRDATIPVE